METTERESCDHNAIVGMSTLLQCLAQSDTQLQTERLRTQPGGEGTVAHGVGLGGGALQRGLLLATGPSADLHQTAAAAALSAAAAADATVQCDAAVAWSAAAAAGAEGSAPRG